MNIARYKDVEEVFVKVVDLQIDQRRARIEQLTNDQELIKGIEELLKEHDRLSQEGFMESGILGDSPKWDSVESEVSCPAKIKEYTIIKVLGKGASGTVYLAKSPPPLERLVALKLINHGAGKMTLARFREEQRLLALLEHPGIAKVYDEGVSEGGRPFTVLEYIKGVSITEYCRANDLDWRSIGEMMIQCCDAVSHAHHRNIIHRDINPSNLMVTHEDGIARVKVIDFGIAKLSDPFLVMPRITIDSHFVGTLPYTSPEQLSGSETPDTRTDVYALGVVLYECLAGEHPFALQGGGLKTTIDAIMTKPIPVLEVPSGIPMREFSAIVAKACAKEPADRYSSPTHMSEDLECLLSGFPVRAMRHHPVYLGRKFVWRHRTPLSLALVVFMLLAWLGWIAIDRSIQAHKNRDALRETAIRLIEDLLPKLADLSGTSDARRELAASLHERVDELLQTDPNDHELLIHKAYILEYESDMLLANGQVTDAEEHRIESAKIVNFLIEHKYDHPLLLGDQRRLIIKIGDIAKQRKDYRSARFQYEMVHQLLLEAPGDHREGLSWSYERLCWIAQRQSRPQDAIELANQRLSLSLELYQEDPKHPNNAYNCATAHEMMSEIFYTKGEIDPAFFHAMESKTFATRLIQLDPDKFSYQVMELRGNVVAMKMLYSTGKIEEADALTQDIIQLAHQIVDRNPGRSDVHKIAWYALGNIQIRFEELGRNQEAQVLLEEMDILVPEFDGI